MTEEDKKTLFDKLDQNLKNQDEIIKRLQILEKGLNLIIPKPMKFRKPDEEKLIGYKEVCDIIGLSVTSVQQMSKDGRLPFHYVNGKRKYSPTELKEWITHRPKHNNE